MPSGADQPDLTTAATEEITPDTPVRRIMATNIAAVETRESLFSVAQELTADNIGAVLVASPGTAPGVLSERDIVTLVAHGSDLDSVRAGEVMTGDLVIAHPEHSIAAVGRLMLDAGVRHVAIRDQDRLVGLVSMRDVLAVLLPGPREPREA